MEGNSKAVAITLFWVFLERRREGVKTQSAVLFKVGTAGLEASALAAEHKRIPNGEMGGRRMSKTIYWR